MSNPLFRMLMGNQVPQQQPPRQQTPQPQMNPFQRANAVYQAMRNPAAFVRQMIPDIPPEIVNDPNQILGWLKQNRGLTDAQIQQVAGMIPHF